MCLLKIRLRPNFTVYLDLFTEKADVTIYIALSDDVSKRRKSLCYVAKI
ncbi:hypothetical protein SAMN04487910_0970 [Aquimarina amphilecti]|uniref:Uncharacterized protein n=1 Tax=Aquimarina amphilecti TaxID=1038014 RepID=A0A1H7JEU2_AQUAM|nr:hypothetical protein SAMN04487910_0970 [Aquimarina amphilecti]